MAASRDALRRRPFLKRMIDERVKLPISARWREGSHFHVHVKDDEVVIEALSR